MRIRGGDVDAILRIQLVNADNEDVWRYSIIHDSRRESSIEAWNRVDGLVNAWSLTMTTARLEGVGLDVNATLEPVRRASGSELTDVADVGERSGRIFSLFVPFFVTLWTATLAIQPSIDMTAGERERQTLEALLATPATRKELLVGKWLAVSTIAAAGVITQFAGLGIAIAVLTRGTTMFTAHLHGPTFCCTTNLLSTNCGSRTCDCNEGKIGSRSRSTAHTHHSTHDRPCSNCTISEPRQHCDIVACRTNCQSSNCDA